MNQELPQWRIEMERHDMPTHDARRLWENGEPAGLSEEMLR
jgi:ribosomal protein L39E